MNTLFQDFRYGLRMLRKLPGFTAVTVLTLALGIGANTAIFSLINAILLNMLPVKEPQQLVIVGDPARAHDRNLGTPQPDLFSYPLYRQFRDSNNVFSGILASGEIHRLKVEIDSAGELTDRALGVLVTGNYFSVLGVNTLLGRTVNTDDDKIASGNPVVVISYEFWKQKLSGDKRIVGQSIRLNGNPYVIIGVTPPGFFGDTVGDNQDMWIPLAMQAQLMPGRPWLEDYRVSWLRAIGRLKPGIDLNQAAANLNVIFQQVWSGPSAPKLDAGELGAVRRFKIKVEDGGRGLSTLRGDFRFPLQLLMAIVALVLLIACVNVTNLLLGRASARSKEFAVRLSLGAAPWRLVRQLLTESLLLAFTGGAFGLLVASWGTQALLKLSLDAADNEALHASLDVRVLLFTAGVSVVTGIIFGLVPALRALRFEVTSALKDNSQNQSRTSAGWMHWNWGKILVGAQMALSLLVLFAAGLLVRTLSNLKNLDLGYNREHLLLVRIDPVAAGYKAVQFANLYNDLVPRLRSIPGVRAGTVSENGLFSGTESATDMKIEGYTSNRTQDTICYFDWVGPNYFSALGIGIVQGREIGPQDTATSPKIAVINQAMARFYFGNSNPLRRKLWVNDEEGLKHPIEIVGIARDAHDHEVRKPVARRFYLALAQSTDPPFAINFELRTVGNPAALGNAVRKEIRDFDAHLPIERVKTLDELVKGNINQDILIARLSSFFAILALLLACIGLYGVMSYSVTGRTREIGVRMALGAARPDVLWLVLGEAMKPVAAGMLIGIPAALVAGRFISTLLFRLGPMDPISLVAVIFLLTAVATLAGAIPARRATKVDPMVALRYE